MLEDQIFCTAKWWPMRKYSRQMGCRPETVLASGELQAMPGRNWTRGVCVSVSTVSKPPAAQPVPDMSLSAAAPIRDRTRQYQTQCESTPSKNGPMRMSLWQIPPQIAPVRGIPRRPKSNHAVVIDCTKRIRVPISEPTVSSVAGNAESAELFRPLIYSHCPDLPGATTQTSTMAILNPTIEQVKASVDAALEAANASLRALNKNVFMSNPYSYKSSY